MPKQKKKKTIYLPFVNQAVCGHNPEPQMSGREEGLLCVETKKAIYAQGHIFGVCSKCDERDKKIMMKKALAMEKKQ